MKQDIHKHGRFATGKKTVGDFKEMMCGGYILPVVLNAKVLTFALRGVEFRIHQSVLARDALACVEGILELRKDKNDIACMENPLIEIGLNGSDCQPHEIAIALPVSGMLRFHQHLGSGRLWACAIEELTARDRVRKRRRTIAGIAREEFARFMVIHPEVQSLVNSMACKLDDILGTKGKVARKKALSELLAVRHALNPGYEVMQTVEWFVRGEGECQLANRIIADAIISLRWGPRKFPASLATPISGLRELVEETTRFELMAILWKGSARKPKLIPVYDWFPETRLSHSLPAYEYEPKNQAK